MAADAIADAVIQVIVNGCGPRPTIVDSRPPAVASWCLPARAPSLCSAR